MTTPPIQNQSDERLNLASFANSSWFKDKATSSVWVRGYRMMRVPPDQLKGAQTLDLGNVRTVFFRGTFNYLDTSAEVPKTGQENVIHMGSLSAATAPKDAYLILLSPHAVDGQAGSEQRTRDMISSAAGFLGLMSGHNIIYTHLFDNIAKADGTGNSAFGKGVIVPTTLPATDLGELRLKKFSEVSAALESLPEADVRRIKLSLRWFNRSEGVGGIDEFVSRWIALETLAMPDDTDIRPANESLARTYGITYEQAVENFFLGRLFGLRSRIVHKGETPAIHSKLLDYLSALYRDIFNETLKLPSERMAETSLANNSEAITKALTGTMKKSNP